jgi:hypothetical protein
MRAENYDGGKVAIQLVDDVILAQLQLLDIIHMGTVGREMIVTSAVDRSHSQKSLHYLGLAIDVRTADLSHQDADQLRENIAFRLGNSWDVVLESDHMHIEYDPKRKRVR